ncbi:MAG: prefoldin subunit alpha [Candidatus Woesearchaeota archaeon]|jgi:prefoldin alpha subunit|nr:prefoldin subunit alpha [Candidatus Woesearchaeota archaeon]|tara:strand:- start:388 stop:804 length:417 start_codon:yes stop_codon:yes gene_type:complete
MKAEEQQALQQRYMELQMINNQIKQYQKQIQLFENQLIELDTLNQGIINIGSTKPGTEILASLGPGIFVKAELKDNKNFLVNVGSGTNVKKDASSTQELINNQAEQLKKLLEQSMGELQNLTLQARTIEQDISTTLKE